MVHVNVCSWCKVKEMGIWYRRSEPDTWFAFDVTRCHCCAQSRNSSYYSFSIASICIVLHCFNDGKHHTTSIAVFYPVWRCDSLNGCSSRQRRSARCRCLLTPSSQPGITWLKKRVPSPCLLRRMGICMWVRAGLSHGSQAAQDSQSACLSLRVCFRGAVRRSHYDQRILD